MTADLKQLNKTKNFTMERTIQIYVAVTILLTIYFGLPATGNGRFSYRLAKAVCTSAVKFAKTNQIQPVSTKPSPVKNAPCKTFTWNNCEKFADKACLRFQSQNCQSQNIQTKKPKINNITNGTDALPHEFPHLVRITKNGKPQCGGTILNEDYVLTSAHCFYSNYNPNNPQNFEIVAGEHNIQVNEGTEQIRQLKHIVYHEQFVKATLENDIALVKVSRPFEFSDYVFPPKMPQLGYDATGQIGTVIGWGNLSLAMSEKQSDVLQKVDLTIISETECVAAYANESSSSHIPATVVCATSEDEDTVPCIGDFGWPLSVRSGNDCDLFIGIASFGHSCSDPFPSVFTEISKYIDWIKAHAFS